MLKTVWISFSDTFMPFFLFCFFLLARTLIKGNFKLKHDLLFRSSSNFDKTFECMLPLLLSF